MSVVEAAAAGQAKSPDKAAGDAVPFLAAVARILFTDGETTRRTVLAVERLGQALGLEVAVSLRWGEIVLRLADPAGSRLEWIPATPLGVDMHKIAETNALIDRFCSKTIGFDEARAALATIPRLPPVSLARFVLLTAAGAAALGVIFGAGQWPTLCLIAFGAGVGALLRRWLATLGNNPFAQPFGAALIAGVIGAIAARFQFVAMPHLIAVCPCMVLVPGPHFLNGAIDLARTRIALGGCRIGYAGLTTLVISVGLLSGLSLGDLNLPASSPAGVVPLGYDVIAAGVAVAAYGTFFAMPWRMLPIPIVIGMLAHALRWLVIVPGGGSAETGALAACFLVGVIVTPVADRLRMPFAAFAFASVVSLIPGVYIFRMASGLLNLIAPGHGPSPDLLLGTMVDGATALLIIVAMGFGLIVPKLVIEYLFPTLTDAEPAAGD
jgi:uncharacterized membrane protein YjjP (DUF1212 family)